MVGIEEVSQRKSCLQRSRQPRVPMERFTLEARSFTNIWGEVFGRNVSFQSISSLSAMTVFALG